MIALLVVLQLLVTQAAPLQDGSEAINVSPDGGEVPTVAPDLTPKLAPILAPELVSDGGTGPVATPASLSVYSVQLPVEAAITAGSLGLFLIVDFVVKPTLEGDISCRRQVGNGRCHPEDLASFDRYAVGRQSKQWQGFGDAALVASIVAPFVYLGLESLALPTTTPLLDYGNDLLVVAEAIALTGAMQTILKFTFKRPRPERYTDAPLGTFEQEVSFPSGHTAMVAAATTALTTTAFLRHPRSPVKYVVLGSGLLLTSLTAISRVESGQHFPTDVIVGALVGGFAGVVVPWLHRRDVPVVPQASFNPATGQSMFGIAGEF